MIPSNTIRYHLWQFLAGYKQQWPLAPADWPYQSGQTNAVWKYEEVGYFLICFLAGKEGASLSQEGQKYRPRRKVNHFIEIQFGQPLPSFSLFSSDEVLSHS